MCNPLYRKRLDHESLRAPRRNTSPSVLFSDVAEQFLQRSLGGDAAVRGHDETISDRLDLTQEV